MSGAKAQAGQSVVGCLAPEAIGPLFADGVLDASWQTEDGEFVWLFENGLVLLLTLKWQRPCRTCGRRDADSKWSLMLDWQLAHRLFSRSYGVKR